jgi:hypothetical protein
MQWRKRLNPFKAGNTTLNQTETLNPTQQASKAHLPHALQCLKRAGRARLHVLHYFFGKNSTPSRGYMRQRDSQTPSEQPICNGGNSLKVIKWKIPNHVKNWQKPQ